MNVKGSPFTKEATNLALDVEGTAVDVLAADGILKKKKDHFVLVGGKQSRQAGNVPGSRSCARRRPEV